MTKKTKSEGKTLEEANNINKSLMVLGNFHVTIQKNHFCLKKSNYNYGCSIKGVENNSFFAHSHGPTITLSSKREISGHKNIQRLFNEDILCRLLNYSILEGVQLICFD